MTRAARSGGQGLGLCCREPTPFRKLTPFARVRATVAVIASNGARQVVYGERDIISISAWTRFTTLIRLPKGEQILDFICGDKENWQVSGVQNFAFIKPAKPGASTSLHLVTAAGTVYAFVLTEGETRARRRIWNWMSRLKILRCCQPSMVTRSSFRRRN